MAARVLSIVIGALFAATAFLWPHDSAQFWNTIVVGAAIVVVAFLSLGAPRARFMNSVLGVWLLLSPLIFQPIQMGSFYMDFLTGATILLLSFAPPLSPRLPQGPAPVR
jgi:hypothetical protein